MALPDFLHLPSSELLMLNWFPFIALVIFLLQLMQSKQKT
jgi:hypothetical protein